MNKIKITAFLICIFIVLSICGCSTTKVQNKRYVAVIVKSVNSDFFQKMKNGVNSAATEYSVKVTFDGPANEEDYRSQNRMIEQAVKDGADAVLLSSIDYKNSDEAVENAVKNGVKVITIDSDVSSSQVSQFIGTDSRQAGRSAANAAAGAFKNNTKICIGIVNCTETTANIKQREEGFREAVFGFSNAEITAAVTAESNIISAKNAAVKLITEYPQINVLVGFNEWLTLGVGEAIKECSVADSVSGIGFDTNVVSISMLETGEMDALVVQNPFAIGYLGVKNAAALIEGEQLLESMVYTSVTVVDKLNMFNDNVQKILFGFN